MYLLKCPQKNQNIIEIGERLNSASVIVLRHSGLMHNNIPMYT